MLLTINQMTECVMPALECDTTSTHITLTDGFGKIEKCEQEVVIRFRKYNKQMILPIATELNYSCIIHGLMSIQIYLVAFLPWAITDVCNTDTVLQGYRTCK